MQLPVFIPLRRSLILHSLLVAAHCAAAMAVALVPLPWVLRAPVLAFVVVSLFKSLRPGRIVALRLGKDGGLACGLADGREVPARLLPGGAVFVGLVVLRLVLDGERRAVELTLLPDHMGRDEFRALRLWLRWAVTPGTAAGQTS